MSSNIVNIEDAPTQTVEDFRSFFGELEPIEIFAFERRKLGRAAGSQQLGCSHMIIPPGKTAFPFHWHSNEEESVYVIKGQGLLRLGAPSEEEKREGKTEKSRKPIRAGDYISFLAGPDHCHQIINTHPSEPLEYICISSEKTTEVCVYPDGNKISANSLVGGIDKWFRADSNVGYFVGEPRSFVCDLEPTP